MYACIAGNQMEMLLIYCFLCNGRCPVKATRRTHTREVSGGERSDTGVPQAVTGFLYYPQSEMDGSRGPRILKRISVMGKGIVGNQESRCASSSSQRGTLPLLAYSCRNIGIRFSLGSPLLPKFGQE
jgi:hypothetical protein